MEAGERVTLYANEVVSGRIVTGRWVRLAAERHLRDLEDGAARGLRFDPALAGDGLRFYPIVLRHYKGEWGPLLGVRSVGLPVELGLWQCFVIGSIFGWLRRDSTGQWIRRFRKALVEVAKKNGKTLMLAGLGLELAFFDNEPGAEVYSAATKRDQARLLWGDAAEMTKRSPALSRRIKANAASLFDPHTASRFKPLSAETGGEEGINPYAVLLDELHRARDRTLLDMLSESGGARRWSFLGMITTAGEPGPSIWAEEHEYAERVLEGYVDDDGLFAVLYTLDHGDDWRDPAVWPKANPNIDVSVKRDDLARAVQEAVEKPGKRPAVLRLRFNLRVSSSAKVIDLDAWDLGDRPWVAEEGAEAWGGLDLGWSRDLSALTLWIPNDDGSFDWRQRFWCPEESAGARQARDRIPYPTWAEDGYLDLTEGNVRDDDAVVRGVLEECATFKVRQIRFDRAMSTNIVNRLTAAGITVEPQSQTVIGIGPAWKELDRLYRAGLIRHQGNPALRWMAGNVEAKEDDNGNVRPIKPHENSPQKIDGISSGLDAIAGWLEDMGEPGPTGSAYDGLTEEQIVERMLGRA